MTMGGISWMLSPGGSGNVQCATWWFHGGISAGICCRTPHISAANMTLLERKKKLLLICSFCALKIARMMEVATDEYIHSLWKISMLTAYSSNQASLEGISVDEVLSSLEVELLLKGRAFHFRKTISEFSTNRQPKCTIYVQSWQSMY